MDADVISQKEYLKKYLSSGTGEEKKKKKKKKVKVGQKTVKIIDDDIDLKKFRPIADGEFDIFINAEDAPQIAGVVDERGPVDFSDKRKWKIIADGEDGELQFKRSEKSKHVSVLSGKKGIAKEDAHNKSIDSRASDSDVSPPRRIIEEEEEEEDVSPPRKKKKFKHSKKSKQDYDSDLGLPKQSRKDEDSDFSPARKRRVIEDTDLNLPRKSKKGNHSNYRHSKTYERGHDSDLNLPRKSKNGDYSDFKHSKKSKPDYDSDLSPPRKSRKGDDPNLISPRRSKKGDRFNLKHSQISKQDNDSDLSPPRKDKRQHIDFKENQKFQDLTKLSKKYNETGSSSSYKYKKYGSDQSPSAQSKHKGYLPERSRKGRWKDNDNPYKHHAKDNSLREKERSTRWDDRSDQIESINEESIKRHDVKMKKTLSGRTAGLQDAKALREESEAFKKREAEIFSKLSKEITGAGQTAIVRDSKTGRKRDLEAEAAEEREKEKRQEELNEKYEKWGRGLKQVENREEKLKDDLYEMSKPLARYADDADLDKQLREQEREGDPMLEYIRQKQIKSGKRKPDRPQYQGSYMPNRFGIKPGHRWDGVDRSNGYEKKWYDAQNAKLARQEEAYKWSTADM